MEKKMAVTRESSVAPKERDERSIQMSNVESYETKDTKARPNLSPMTDTE